MQIKYFNCFCQIKNCYLKLNSIIIINHLLFKSFFNRVELVNNMSRYWV
jgi:hypothetical protein